MNRDDGDSFASFVVGIITGFGAMAAIFVAFTTPLSKDNWQCTAQRVIKDTLPTETSCSQYTFKPQEGKL